MAHTFATSVFCLNLAQEKWFEFVHLVTMTVLQIKLLLLIAPSDYLPLSQKLTSKLRDYKVLAHYLTTSGHAKV